MNGGGRKGLKPYTRGAGYPQTDNTPLQVFPSGEGEWVVPWVTIGKRSKNRGETLALLMFGTFRS